jgi:hypothetical protein
MNEPWWIDLIKAFVIVNLLLLTFAYMTLVERKLIGRMQLRYGPNRAGPRGILQPIADLVKLIRKEPFYPATAIEVLYITAPALSAATALAAFAVIPFGEGWHIGDYYVSGQVANVSIGLILLFALGSVGIYGFIVGGWASDSKYSLLGAMRTCAQLVSYEVSLALRLVVRGPAVRRPDRLLHRRDRGDEPRAVRPPGSRDRARSRLPDRVQRHALRPLLDGRVREHDRALGPQRDPLLRRLGRAG